MSSGCQGKGRGELGFSANVYSLGGDENVQESDGGDGCIYL